MDKDNDLMQELLAEVKECRADVKRIKTLILYGFFGLIFLATLIGSFSGINLIQN